MKSDLVPKQLSLGLSLAKFRSKKLWKQWPLFLGTFSKQEWRWKSVAVGKHFAGLVSETMFGRSRIRSFLWEISSYCHPGFILTGGDVRMDVNRSSLMIAQLLLTRQYCVKPRQCEATHARTNTHPQVWGSARSLSYQKKPKACVSSQAPTLLQDELIYRQAKVLKHVHIKR